LAQAVLADPHMLILDEATARVDTLTEQLIQATLQRLLTGRTAIVTAHRLSTIRNADLICVVQASSIIERGRHEALVAHGGLYRQLYDRRFVDVATGADEYRTISIVRLTKGVKKAKALDFQYAVKGFFDL